MELVVATTNAGKLREIRRLLAETGIEVLGLEDMGEFPQIVEDADTFSENARKKALTVARICNRLTLADDSGLEVPAIGNAPGVHSARYAGENATDSDNNRKLLAALDGLPREGRKARFRCTMALCEPDGACRFFTGTLDGLVLEAARGEGGFGYDPLFLVPEYGKSLAELSLDIKNRISHRGQALRQVAAHLQNRSDLPIPN